jgi:hypothetical protein
VGGEMDLEIEITSVSELLDYLKDIEEISEILNYILDYNEKQSLIKLKYDIILLSVLKNSIDKLITPVNRRYLDEYFRVLSSSKAKLEIQIKVNGWEDINRHVRYEHFKNEKSKELFKSKFLTDVKKFMFKSDYDSLNEIIKGIKKISKYQIDYIVKIVSYIFINNTNEYLISLSEVGNHLNAFRDELNNVTDISKGDIKTLILLEKIYCNLTVSIRYLKSVLDDIKRKYTKKLMEYPI